MFHPNRWLPTAAFLGFLGGCATPQTGSSPDTSVSSLDRGDYILLLSSSRSPTMESRFASLAQVLNERAELDPALEPYFAARQPATVQGVQLVYGLVEGEFGVAQNPEVEALLRRDYPDLRWVYLGP